MKRVLLSLLTAIAIGGISAFSFAQIDTSKKINSGNLDKWEIIKVNAKTSTGKLYVKLPKDSEWDMTIYAAGSKKVFSNTMLKTSFALKPGIYDLEINHLWIKGVPVEKGNNTRLKAGVLDIMTRESWTLTDETIQTVLINSYGPQKRGLPVGRYTFATMGQTRKIEIKDGGTTADDYTLMDDKSSLIPQLQSDQWDITPSGGIPDGMGRLDIKLPGSQSMTIPVSGESIEIPDLTYCDVVIRGNSLSSTDTIKVPINLARGTYNIRLNKAFIDNVPIQEGKVTRLKAGYLIITLDYGDLWNLSGRHNDNYYSLFESQHKPGIYALPPGEYFLYKNPPSQRYKVMIIDGQTVINGVKL